MNKYHKRLIPVVPFLLLWASYQVPKVAAEETSLQVQNLDSWDNGVDFSVENNGSDRIHLKARRADDAEGSTASLFLYEFDERDMADFAAITINIDNQGDQDFPLNLSLNQSEEGQAYTVAADQPGWLITEQDGQVLSTQVRDTGFIIPGNFSGTLYIPFTSFNGDGIPDDISTIGLNFFLDEDSPVDAIFSNAQLLETSETTNYTFIEIDGENALQVPIHGETMINFTAKSDQNDAIITFALQNPVDGVAISESGVLTANADANPEDTVTVVAKDDQSDTAAMITVNLQELTAGQVDQALPLPSQVDTYTNTWIKNLKDYTWLIRLLVIILILFVCEIIGRWVQANKKYNRDSQALADRAIKWKRRIE